jgi:hypothetical protein
MEDDKRSTSEFVCGLNDAKIPEKESEHAYLK